jgi:hypothetical protein
MKWEGRAFGCKWNKGLGCCINWNDEELHNLFPTLNTIITIKSKMVGWAWHVARMGEKRSICTILVGKPETKVH